MQLQNSGTPKLGRIRILTLSGNFGAENDPLFFSIVSDSPFIRFVAATNKIPYVFIYWVAVNQSDLGL